MGTLDMNPQWVKTAERLPDRYGNYVVIHVDEDFAWQCVRPWFPHTTHWGKLEDEDAPIYWLEGLEFPMDLPHRIHGDSNK